MKKLILWLIGAAVALAGLLMAFSWLSGAMGRPSESYAEQQARIAREAANSEFWHTMLTGAGLVLAFILVMAVFAIHSHLDHKRKMERARFERDYNVLAFDQLGNGPVIYDRENNQLITTQPGNTAYAPQYTFVHGAMPQPVKEPKRQNYEVPLVINAGGMKIAQPESGYTVKEVQPQQLPTADPARNLQQFATDFQAVAPQKDDCSNQQIVDFGPELVSAKERGGDKVKSITSITGCKAGSNKAYQTYSKFWDSIEV